MSNRFADVDDISTLVYVLIGAGSSCWDNLPGAGVFESEVAAEMGREGVERMNELIGAMV